MQNREEQTGGNTSSSRNETKKKGKRKALQAVGSFIVAWHMTSFLSHIPLLSYLPLCNILVKSYEGKILTTVIFWNLL